MHHTHGKTIAIGTLCFLAGLAAANLPFASASGKADADLSTRKFTVFVDEVKQNLAFGDHFSGSYAKTFTLSDGSRREIELTPMVHDGKQVVQLKDSGGLTWMSLDGATTNGTLMIRVSDDAATHDALRRQGWK